MDIQLNLKGFTSKLFPKIYYPVYYYETIQLKFGMKDVYPNISDPVPPEKIKVNTIKHHLNLFTLLYFLSLIAVIILIFLVMLIEEIIDIEFPWTGSIRIALLLGLPLLISLFVSYYFRTSEKEKKSIKKEEESQELKYQKQLIEYKEKQRIVNSETIQTQHKIKILKVKAKEYKSEILRQSKILLDQDVKKGISELFFHDYLIKYSNFTIYKSLKFGFYFPDIIIIDPINSFVIDIEIDEPYAYESNEPIHYDDVDVNRDIYFTQNNFIVIRFAEEQIINAPDYCLKIINKTIDSIQTLKEPDSITLSYTVPAWNYESAFSKAYNHSRKNIHALVQLARIQYL